MKWALFVLPALFAACASPPDDGGGLEPGMAYLNIINDLGWYDITAVYYRLVNDPRFPDGYPESYWDVNRIYHEGPLEPGEEITFEVEQDLYDVRCISLSRHPGDPDRHYHTRYGADITQDGYTWEVTRDDEDE